MAQDGDICILTECASMASLAFGMFGISVVILPHLVTLWRTGTAQ